MQTKQGRRLQSLRSVQSFLNAHAGVLAGVAASGSRHTLDQIVGDLDAYGATQSASFLAAQGATRKYYALRAALLRDHMAPIAKIAAALLRDIPELEPFALPRGKPSAERLEALAIGMARAAEPFAQVFTDAGLPSDFITQLETAAHAVEESVVVRKTCRVACRGATQGLVTQLSRGRKTVGVLDALVKSALKDDPATRAAWEIAKRVGRRTPPVAWAVRGAPS